MYSVDCCNCTESFCNKNGSIFPVDVDVDIKSEHIHLHHFDTKLSGIQWKICEDLVVIVTIVIFLLQTSQVTRKLSER